MDVELTVYLSGEIHTDWRERIAEGVDELDLPVDLTGPVTDHAASDDCGVTILGAEDDSFWKDHKGAKLNAIRTRKGIEDADDGPLELLREPGVKPFPELVLQESL